MTSEMLYCPRCDKLLDAVKRNCARCGYVAGITGHDVDATFFYCPWCGDLLNPEYDVVEGVCVYCGNYANSPNRNEITRMASETWAAGCKLADELSIMIGFYRDEFVNFEMILVRFKQLKHERNEAWAALEAKEKDYREVLAENERLTRERDEARAELTHARDGFDRALTMNKAMVAALEGSE